MRGVEGAREKIQGALAFDFAVKIGEDDRNVAAKFPDDLAASAAGRGEGVCVGDDGDGVEVVFSFGDGFENGDAFGAEGESVGGVFDVASGEDAAGFGAHGGADAKFRKWSVGVFTGGAGRGDQLVVGGHRGIMYSNQRRGEG